MEGVHFGTLPDGRTVERYTLQSDCVQADILNLGATIAAVRTPDRNGVWTDIALGFDNPVDYLERPGCHGATIGRYAGRISHGRFQLNGKLWELEKNRGEHTIHGGPVGFHQRLWTVCSATEEQLVLELFSPDGDQGFPGAVAVRATFRIKKDSLILEFHAKADADTPFNMTNHVYWNLAGHNSGTVDGHILQVPAEEYLETDGENIPTGRRLPLAGTPLDLRKPVEMKTIHADHSFLLIHDGKMHLAGRVYEPVSGRWMEVSTNMPCVQVYTADGMAVGSGKGGAAYGPRKGMCLEAQFCPDSPNHEEFPAAVLQAGKEAIHRICWKFGVEV